MKPTDFLSVVGDDEVVDRAWRLFLSYISPLDLISQSVGALLLKDLAKFQATHFKDDFGLRVDIAGFELIDSQSGNGQEA